MDFNPSAKTLDYRQRLIAFMREHIEPIEAQYHKENRRLNADANWRTRQVPPMVAELKAKARAAGDKEKAAAREKGKYRIEGKEYVVADGDVLHFRFNV